MTPRLHDFLTTERARIIERWTAAIREDLAPDGLTHIELVDHLPSFLDEVSATLQARGAAGEPSDTAARHGTQRLRLGFDLGALVREYGMLRRCLIAMTREAQLRIDADDWHVLAECLIAGIADAATQYAQEREAEIGRQAHEHFAFVAHELRNPLAAAQLSFATLEARGQFPEGRSAEIVKRSLSRMQQLIERTLELSLAGGSAPPQRQPISLRALLEEAALEARALAQEKGVTLALPTGDEGTLDLDRRLIVSALNNLLRNAVKFTPVDGRVTVRVARAHDRVRIAVEDTCGGIPAKNLEALFAPFVQAGSDRSGFGLGLAIAKQAATAHGGSIEVENLPGQGCVFTLDLPIHAL